MEAHITYEIMVLIIVVLAVFVALISIWTRRKERRHQMSFMEGLNLTGFPIVTLMNNDQKLNFVLDTGSVHSLINEGVVKNLEYEDAPYTVTIAGIDNNNREDQKAIQMKLIYKDKITEGMFVITDLSPVFDTVKKDTGVQLHGLLGSEFFRKNKYIIDYKEMIAYSKKI